MGRWCKIGAPSTPVVVTTSVNSDSNMDQRGGRLAMSTLQQEHLRRLEQLQHVSPDEVGACGRA